MAKLILLFAFLYYGHTFAQSHQLSQYFDLLKSSPQVELTEQNCVLNHEVDRSVSTVHIKDKSNSEIELSKVSFEYLNELFNELKSLKYVPYDYPQEGCYARAQAMSQHLDKKNIISAKVFLEGELQVEDKKKRTPIKWWFHVAPVLMTNHHGKEEIYVLDPSLFDRPVSISEWREKQTKYQNSTYKYERRKENIYYTSRFQYLPEKDGTANSYLNEDNLDMKEKMINATLELMKEESE